MTFRAVVFDLDGTMFNTEQLYVQVLEEMLRRRGLPFEWALLNEMMGRPGMISLQIMIDWHKLENTTPHQLYDESDSIFYGILERELAPMPGTLELLSTIEAKSLPKAIATSSRRKVVHHMLDRFELRPRFQFILTSEDVQQGKPNPEIYLSAASKLGFAPAEILVFEDSANGCAAAVAAGMHTIAVPGDHSRHHEFGGAKMIAQSLADPRIYELLG
ncbi:HAD-superfamily hydrolase, subfamily IA, variant 3 [Pirellula staleyi DSM 6068]|uniref:HAD-superfamily hydrolase, subfamily IA, variant 3 n=1 Tax=Pirellula staleyi (strain ATCC 27377 / DSM 6068 / ICPB 4128) TaxID=530564 RepID=D2R739_PIRSD|nr:HAD family phosphatase [Pirellula staleyi]ADB19242.1 HAD-superfamily hydrolase, subfamily IA, variant 3 [Pirellula staleyi DSM 6068]